MLFEQTWTSFQIESGSLGGATVCPAERKCLCRCLFAFFFLSQPFVDKGQMRRIPFVRPAWPSSAFTVTGNEVFVNVSFTSRVLRCSDITKDYSFQADSAVSGCVFVGRPCFYTEHSPAVSISPIIPTSATQPLICETWASRTRLNRKHFSSCVV